MTAVVLDSCALLHWLGAGNALPETIARGTLLMTPAITWCEIAWKHGLGRLSLPMPRDLWMAEADALVTTVAVDRSLFLAAVDLNWGHRDPADRVIVALARAHGAPIVTCDRLISTIHQTIWW